MDSLVVTATVSTEPPYQFATPKRHDPDLKGTDYWSRKVHNNYQSLANKPPHPPQLPYRGGEDHLGALHPPVMGLDPEAEVREMSRARQEASVRDGFMPLMQDMGDTPSKKSSVTCSPYKPHVLQQKHPAEEKYIPDQKHGAVERYPPNNLDPVEKYPPNNLEPASVPHRERLYQTDYQSAQTEFQAPERDGAVVASETRVHREEVQGQEHGGVLYSAEPQLENRAIEENVEDRVHYDKPLKRKIDDEVLQEAWEKFQSVRSPASKESTPHADMDGVQNLIEGRVHYDKFNSNFSPLNIASHNNSPMTRGADRNMTNNSNPRREEVARDSRRTAYTLERELYETRSGEDQRYEGLRYGDLPGTVAGEVRGRASPPRVQARTPPPRDTRRSLSPLPHMDLPEKSERRETVQRTWTADESTLYHSLPRAPDTAGRRPTSPRRSTDHNRSSGYGQDSTSYAALPSKLHSRSQGARTTVYPRAADVTPLSRTTGTELHIESLDDDEPATGLYGKEERAKGSSQREEVKGQRSTSPCRDRLDARDANKTKDRSLESRRHEDHRRDTRADAQRCSVSIRVSDAGSDLRRTQKQSNVSVDSDKQDLSVPKDRDAHRASTAEKREQRTSTESGSVARRNTPVGQSSGQGSTRPDQQRRVTVSDAYNEASTRALEDRRAGVEADRSCEVRRTRQDGTQAHMQYSPGLSYGTLESSYERLPPQQRQPLDRTPPRAPAAERPDTESSRWDSSGHGTFIADRQSPYQQRSPSMKDGRGAETRSDTVSVRRELKLTDNPVEDGLHTSIINRQNYTDTMTSGPVQSFRTSGDRDLHSTRVPAHDKERDVYRSSGCRRDAFSGRSMSPPRAREDKLGEERRDERRRYRESPPLDHSDLDRSNRRYNHVPERVKPYEEQEKRRESSYSRESAGRRAHSPGLMPGQLDRVKGIIGRAQRYSEQDKSGQSESCPIDSADGRHKVNPRDKDAARVRDTEVEHAARMRQEAAQPSEQTPRKHSKAAPRPPRTPVDPIQVLSDLKLVLSKKGLQENLQTMYSRSSHERRMNILNTLLKARDKLKKRQFQIEHVVAQVAFADDPSGVETPGSSTVGYLSDSSLITVTDIVSSDEENQHFRSKLTKQRTVKAESPPRRRSNSRERKRRDSNTSMVLKTWTRPEDRKEEAKARTRGSPRRHAVDHGSPRRHAGERRSPRRHAVDHGSPSRRAGENRSPRRHSSERGSPRRRSGSCSDELTEKQLHRWLNAVSGPEDGSKKEDQRSVSAGTRRKSIDRGRDRSQTPPPRHLRNWSAIEKSKAETWFIPLNDPRPWRKPLREQKAHAASMGTWPRLDPYTAAQLDKLTHRTATRSGRRRSDVDTEIILNKPARPHSLQESFDKCMQGFISRSRQRQRYILLRSDMAQVDALHSKQRSKIFNVAKLTKPNPDAHPLGEVLYKPSKRYFTREEMKAQTDRIYKKLPEVRQKTEDKKKTEVCKTNRLRAKMFEKQIQRRILKKKTHQPC